MFLTKYATSTSIPYFCFVFIGQLDSLFTGKPSNDVTAVVVCPAGRIQRVDPVLFLYSQLFWDTRLNHFKVKSIGTVLVPSRLELGIVDVPAEVALVALPAGLDVIRGPDIETIARANAVDANHD